MLILTGVSARHLHLSQEHLEALFGEGYQLTPNKTLPVVKSQYVCEERLTLKGPKGTIPNVGIIGPVRPQTQVEIAKTDGVKIGLNPPVRLSGDLEGSDPVTLVGPKGELHIDEGLIVAKRHIHMTEHHARELGFSHKDFAMVVVPGTRSLVFDHVVVRVSSEHEHSEIHVDTDEANTADLKTGDMVNILRINDKKIRLERLIAMFDERQLRMVEACVVNIVEEERKKIAQMESMLTQLSTG